LQIFCTFCGFHVHLWINSGFAFLQIFGPFMWD
jgi:hypothetical protein